MTNNPTPDTVQHNAWRERAETDVADLNGGSYGAVSKPSRKLGRYLVAIMGGTVLTFVLGVTMALMVKTNFTIMQKVETQAFDIHPVTEDFAPPTRQRRKALVKDVIVPPPTPRIGTVDKTLPSEPIVAIGGNPDIEWRVDRLEPIDNIIRIDSKEQPLYRSEPVMPLRAEKSGHCVMRFDVSAEGAPYNITAQSCSQDVFARASVRAVAKWKYKAKVLNGQRLPRTGLTTRLTYNLSDERGRLIPE